MRAGPHARCGHDHEREEAGEDELDLGLDHASAVAFEEQGAFRGNSRINATETTRDTVNQTFGSRKIAESVSAVRHTITVSHRLESADVRLGSGISHCA
jgi:hypothetical protein